MSVVGEVERLRGELSDVASAKPWALVRAASNCVGPQDVREDHASRWSDFLRATECRRGSGRRPPDRSHGWGDRSYEGRRSAGRGRSRWPPGQPDRVGMPGVGMRSRSRSLLERPVHSPRRSRTSASATPTSAVPAVCSILSGVAHPGHVLPQDGLVVVGHGPPGGGREGMAVPDQVQELGRSRQLPERGGEFAGPLALLTGLEPAFDLGLADPPRARSSPIALNTTSGRCSSRLAAPRGAPRRGQGRRSSRRAPAGSFWATAGRCGRSAAT